MKTVKMLVGLAMLNAVVMVAVVGVVGKQQAKMQLATTAGQVESINTQQQSANSTLGLNNNGSGGSGNQQTKTTATPEPATQPSQIPVDTTSPNPTQAATPTPAATTTPPTPPPQDNRCLIQIDGVVYDVTQFRFQHSGGNIFSCNTDMSQIFWSRHNQRILDQMQRYRI